MNLSKKLIATVLVALFATPVLSQQITPLFSPMPLASIQRKQDPMLDYLLADPATKSLERVQVQANLIDTDTQELRLNLAAGVDMVVSGHGKRSDNGMITWSGRVIDKSLPPTPSPQTHDGTNTVLLIRNGNRLGGNIVVDGEKFILISLISGGHALYTVDESKFPREGDPIRGEERPITTSLSTKIRNAPEHDKMRVMFVFSKDALQLISHPEEFAQRAVDLTNESFDNSGVTHRVEASDALYQSDYVGSRDLRSVLHELSDPDDGNLDWVHQLRDLTKSDVVTLVVGYGSECGRAYSRASEDLAFSVVTAGCALGQFSYTHELGHIYGADHDPANTSGGFYSYGHGYVDIGAKARTIMAYDCTGGCKRYNVWSSPNNQINGVVAGTAKKHDNTRVLNERAATVAAFR